MSPLIRIVAFLGVPLAVWLMLGMPDAATLGSILPVLLAFGLFWAITMFQRPFLRLVGVDMDVYDNVVPWLFDTLNLAAAVIALVLCAVGIFGGESVRAALASGPALGLAMLVALVLLLLPALFARRTLGVRGVQSVKDPRKPMSRGSTPVRSLAEFEESMHAGEEEKNA